MNTRSARRAGSSGEYGTTISGCRTVSFVAVDSWPLACAMCEVIVKANSRTELGVAVLKRLANSDLNGVRRQLQLLQQEVANAMATLTSAPNATPSTTLCHALDKSGEKPTATRKMQSESVNFPNKDAELIRHTSRMTTKAATRRMAAICPRRCTTKLNIDGRCTESATDTNSRA